MPEAAAEERSIPRAEKLILYALSLAGAFLVMAALRALFGQAGTGFPSFSDPKTGPADYALLLMYIPAGLLLFAAFAGAEKLTKEAARRIPQVLRETICGICVGTLSLVAPVVLFSGEDQMGSLPETFVSYGPLLLLGICLLKIFMTAFCIEFGMKGGHFFPLIFACACMGFALAMTAFGNIGGIADPGSIAGHAVFASAAVTAAALGAQMRKPLAVSMLLLICFPLRLVPWILLAAAAGSSLSGMIKKRTGSTGDRSSAGSGQE